MVKPHLKPGMEKNQTSITYVNLELPFGFSVKDKTRDTSSNPNPYKRFLSGSMTVINPSSITIRSHGKFLPRDVIASSPYLTNPCRSMTVSKLNLRQMFCARGSQMGTRRNQMLLGRTSKNGAIRGRVLTWLNQDSCVKSQR
jgi:hypothetical protein